MTDVGLGELVLRMLMSLGIVLAIVFGAYAVLRRRSGQLGSTRERGGRGRSSGKHGLRIIARTGLGRSTSVVVIEFADRVLLVGSSESAAPTVLAELDAETWERSTTPDDGPPSIISSSPARPANLFEALREATTRRG